MKRDLTIPAILSGMVWLVTVLVTPATGYEVATHREMSRAAAERSTLDGILKDSLGVAEGLRERMNGRRLVDWIAEGSRLEDEGGFFAFRYRHHFHNPLRSWDAAGLRATLPPPLDFLGLQIGRSSILWGQDGTQEWSWPRVRQYYLQALTAGARDGREKALADTFRGLGHLIHLVQDAAVPAHTRNDPHVAYNYEKLVQDVQNSADPFESGFFAFLLSIGQDPDTRWTTLPSNSLAPVSIARLIDTERYKNGTNPAVTTEALIGLAEYTNANFFSEDTTFNEDLIPPSRFPFPGRSSVREQDYFIQLQPGGTEFVRRRYYQKFRDGETGFLGLGYRLATVGFLRDYLQQHNLDPSRFHERPALDAEVYKDYAFHLVPRAVGYSTALLDYFFRGTLDFEVKLDTADPTQREITITNTSPELMAGDFKLYAENASETRGPDPVATFPLSLAAEGGKSDPLTFTPPGGARAYVLVFEGTLGAEEERAVAGKVKPWDLPLVFVIQEEAALTGEEQRDEVVEEDSPVRYRASSGRFKDEGKQRAKGRFFFPGESTPGEYIRRVSLFFDDMPGVPDPSVQQVRLRLNGIEVGQAWDREVGPALVPATWEIVVDLPAIIEARIIFPGFPPVLFVRLPRFLEVETLTGNKIQAPLLWWSVADSKSLVDEEEETRSPVCLAPEQGCLQRSVSQQNLRVRVLFGDGVEGGLDVGGGPLSGRHPLSALHTRVGFAPTGAVAGFSVGTLPDLEGARLGRCEVGQLESASVKVFADFFGPDRIPVWDKNSAHVTVTNEDHALKPPGTCGRPAQIPAVPAPLPLPELRFRRDYLPRELEQLNQFNIIPPEYEIILK